MTSIDNNNNSSLLWNIFMHASVLAVNFKLHFNITVTFKFLVAYLFFPTMHPLHGII